MSTSVKTVAIFNAKKGREDDLHALLRSMVTPSRAEPGNLRYDLWRETEQPGRFVLDELYVNADAITQHRASPHFQGYLARINDLADRTVVVLSADDVG
ncbi:putative quinol monooxygenase [Dyella sp. C11]|uniref:putative quinol monooxygenase n=1 Tax=Dyella sp. C11 TaxID=2126991 RepID=UPI000D65D998|nr:putative quinol monooxygenase [Dyella sp. C11]